MRVDAGPCNIFEIGTGVECILGPRLCNPRLLAFAINNRQLDLTLKSSTMMPSARKLKSAPTGAVKIADA